MHENIIAVDMEPELRLNLTTRYASSVIRETPVINVPSYK